MSTTSDAEMVYQFTQESRGTECPKFPMLMNQDSVKFLIRMVCSEMAELARTVTDTPEEAVEFVRNCVGADHNADYKKPTSEAALIGEQADAMVDAWYYMLNSAAKHGVNLSSLFQVVHAANMAKRWDDGTFHRREDGKVVKPPNWKEPDITAEIERQLKEGSF